MTESITQDSKPSFGVTFSKKVSDGNYGGEEVSFWVSADVPAGAEMKATSEALAAAAFIAKALTFQELGLEFENRDGILFALNKAKVERHFGKTVEVDPENEGLPADRPAAGVRVKGTQHGELPAWLIEAAAKDGVTEVWDNRDKVAGSRRPHFSDVVKDAAGKSKGYWPPSKP